MIRLPPQRVVELPVGELAEVLLVDLVASGTWSEWNYLNDAERGRYRGEAANAIAGAFGWLRGQGFIGRDPRNGSSDSAIVVTPAGRKRALEAGAGH